MEKYKICVSSNIGKVRKRNEDNFYFNGKYRKDLNTPNITIYEERNISSSNTIAVFDGMGGEREGDKASLIAAEKLMIHEQEAYSKDVELKYEKVIKELNDEVCNISKKLKCQTGTTAVIMNINHGNATVCNVGDSRAYLFRDMELMQITEDHTEEAYSVKMHKILGIDVGILNAKNQNTLTQHLGISEDEFILEPYISDSIKVCKGDIYLLCSDGLTHLVEDAEISHILNMDLNIKDKVQKLQVAALNYGGTDNITIILVEVV